MQNLFYEVNSLDKRCYDEFFLSEDILMEHAADGMAKYIQKRFKKGSRVILVVGSGNNGADAIALSRLLHKDFNVYLYLAKELKSPMAKLQYKRAKAIGVKEITELFECDILVDAIVGTGFNGEFNDKLNTLIDKMNSLKAFKIACDTPSGYKFFADVTLTMGALKIDQFLDKNKDYIGKIKVINLGVSREVYEIDSNYKLLDKEDMHLPFRDKKDVHKGSFGHLAVVVGSKRGAGILSALSALKFGSGLVTAITDDKNLPISIMQSNNLPSNATAIAVGMGLGIDTNINYIFNANLPIVADADIFFHKDLIKILKQKDVVLTPHPKEFVNLLKVTNLANVSIDTLQNNRFFYAQMFAKAYPHITLLLKGANVIIAKNDKLFVNPYGSAKLAKGGSGDVLSGLIASLLSQGFDSLNSTIYASLAHTKLSKLYKGADFSLTPVDLIEQIGKL